MRHAPTRTLKQVVTEECANWTRHGCLWEYPCYVLRGERCAYFELAVLPAWPGVAAEYERATAQERSDKSKQRGDQ